VVRYEDFPSNAEFHRVDLDIGKVPLPDDSAIVVVDLRRIAAECDLTDVGIMYSHEGRIPLTRWHYPKFLAKLFPRALSDNLLLIGRKPGA